MENKRLLRSNNRMLAGVCAGIAEYFGWEVSTVRIMLWQPFSPLFQEESSI